MSAPIGPGDWVECVDTSAPNFPTLDPDKSSRGLLTKGAIYQVEAVVPSRLNRPMLQLREVKTLRNEWGAFYAFRFRPVYRPKADLIESLKAPPVRVVSSHDHD